MNNFRPIDRDTGFRLPPSVAEWLPERHLARFVVEVVAGLDLRSMTGSYRGSGEAPYRADHLWHASGVFSGRKLERATYDSVAFRFIAANQHPDHDTITTRSRRSGGASSRRSPSAPARCNTWSTSHSPSANVWIRVVRCLTQHEPDQM
jgi:hypothetical protein